MGQLMVGGHWKCFHSISPRQKHIRSHRNVGSQCHRKKVRITLISPHVQFDLHTFRWEWARWGSIQFDIIFLLRVPKIVHATISQVDRVALMIWSIYVITLVTGKKLELRSFHLRGFFFFGPEVKSYTEHPASHIIHLKFSTGN